MKFIFYWNAIYIAIYEKKDVEAKFSKFVDLNKTEKVIFLFNNIDPYVCKNVATMSMRHLNLGKLVTYRSLGNRDY